MKKIDTQNQQPQNQQNSAQKSVLKAWKKPTYVTRSTSDTAGGSCCPVSDSCAGPCGIPSAYGSAS